MTSYCPPKEPTHGARTTAEEPHAVRAGVWDDKFFIHMTSIAGRIAASQHTAADVDAPFIITGGSHRDA